MKASVGGEDPVGVRNHVDMVTAGNRGLKRQRGGEQFLSDVTRGALVDLLTLDRDCYWAGGIDEVTFLAPLYDLESLPSYDYRYKTAAGDIRQHRVNNDDGPDAWVFADERFGLAHGPDELFLRFLARAVHPTVRRSSAAADEMVAKINALLAADGYEMVVNGSITGRKTFTHQRIDSFHGTRPAALLADRATLGDRATLDRHLKRIQKSVGDDAEAAIGSCKELVESVLKQVLDAGDVSYSKGDDLPRLFKAAAKALELSKSAVESDTKGSDAVTGLLRGLVATVQSLGELRNTVGTGHGRSNPSAAEPRHARLALNAAVTVTEFLFDAWDPFEA